MTRHFSLNKMQEAFAFIEKGFQIFENMDPNGQRFSKIMLACRETFAPNHVSLKRRRTQFKELSTRFLLRRVSNNNSPNQLLMLTIHSHLHP